MATSKVDVSVANQNFHIYTCIASADADTTLTFAHTLGFIPTSVHITALTPQGIASGWVWNKSVTDITNVGFTKTSTAMGTGDAASQIQVWVGRLQSSVA
jgi:hypothetical protein